MAPCQYSLSETVFQILGIYFSASLWGCRSPGGIGREQASQKSLGEVDTGMLNNVIMHEVCPPSFPISPYALLNTHNDGISQGVIHGFSQQP